MVLEALFGSQKQLFVDGEVRSKIEEIVRRATKQLVLVSPYNQHPNHLVTHITEAIARGVDVTIIYRDEEKQHTGVKWLKEQGARVIPVKWLHAKIYMNESVGLAASMNLLDSSFNNSYEFGVLADKNRHPSLYGELAQYVDTLWQRGTPSKAPKPRAAAAAPVAAPAPPPRRAPAPQRQIAVGYCIRCGDEGIPFDPEKPYCRKCYRAWDGYDDSPENRCHSCGCEWGTSIAKPVCLSCYRQLTRR